MSCVMQLMAIEDRILHVIGSERSEPIVLYGDFLVDLDTAFSTHYAYKNLSFILIHLPGSVALIAAQHVGSRHHMGA